MERLRRTGDLRAQRRHVWAVVGRLAGARTEAGTPAFESWHGEAAVFAAPGAAPGRGIRGFARGTPESSSATSADPASASASASADIPVLTFTLYNDAAFRHIRRHRLYLRSTLAHLAGSGAADAEIAGDRTVPAFPPQAVVLKTAWWPVARREVTALPVWDPADNAPRRAGNDYTSWTRAVAIDPRTPAATSRTAPIDFAGRAFPHADRVALGAFHHVVVTPTMARILGRDPGAQKLAAIVLGRPIEAGDYLVLVGGNLATKEIRDWVWAAFWWHDRAEAGPFGADRPATLPAPWRNYLLAVAFDAERPAAADGGPHVCFNPWLEGRFPDGGHGGGTVSNCPACHRRASFPALAFLPVTRGAPDLPADPAYGAGRVRTNFLWSLALHARL